MSSLSAIVNKTELKKKKKKSGEKCRHSNLLTYIHWNGNFAVYSSSSKPWPLQPPHPPPPPLPTLRPPSPHTHTPNTLVQTNVFFLLPHYPHLTPSPPALWVPWTSAPSSSVYKDTALAHITEPEMSARSVPRRQARLGYYCVKIVFVPNAMRSETASLQV